ncbi:hypothetical protein DFH06DRAFT_679439 [Mycena polygramma]|nr:hypothetical protein DFH06DRAFT_679439 [Mycena polygramma]
MHALVNLLWSALERQTPASASVCHCPPSKSKRPGTCAHNYPPEAVRNDRSWLAQLISAGRCPMMPTATMYRENGPQTAQRTPHLGRKALAVLRTRRLHRPASTSFGHSETLFRMQSTSLQSFVSSGAYSLVKHSETAQTTIFIRQCDIHNLLSI